MRRCAVILLFLLATSARGVDLHAGASVDYATSFRWGEDHGWAVAGAVGVRVDELLSFEVAGRWAELVWGNENELRLTAIGAGARLDVDILWITPYVSLRLGWLRIDGRERHDGLGIFFGAGVDFLLADSFSLGLVAEYLGMLTDYSSYPAFGFFGLRANLILPL